jgi:MauM/NapG family ferredoxin protein
VKIRHLVWLRRGVQIFSLSLFLFLLVSSRLSQDIYVDYSTAFSTDSDIRLNTPAPFFFTLDPLIGVTSLLSGHRLIPGFLWGLAVVLVTIFLGRVFCGFICPFGTIHHAVGAVRPALKGDQMVQANQKRPDQRIKYFLLLFLLTGAIFGLNLSGLMDPIALLFRSMALSVIPGIGTGLRSLFDAMAGSDFRVLRLASYGAEVLLSPVFGYDAQAYQTAWFMGFLFFTILFLNRIRPRFWCRVLCPLGALMGIFSMASLLKLEKHPERCTHCNLCTRHCQGAASPHADQVWEAAECIGCFNCHNLCPEGALAFRFTLNPKMNAAPDTGRRAVLGGMLGGISIPFLGRLDGRMDKVADPRLIRPPGSLPENAFLELCQRCGLCMKVCPTNVLHPALGEAGMAGLWTPHLIMTQGYCEYTCSLCGSVCPTGAIADITAREKIEQPVRIGSAYVERGRCLPWSGNSSCIVCEEVCPTTPKAIYLKEITVPGAGGKTLDVQLPYVDLRQCVGCGICENKCPVKGLPAIRTISAGESRSLENQILLF